VYLSLFTSPWWGDSVSQKSGRYTSRIPDIMTKGMLTNQVRLDIIEEAKNALAWMVSEKIAGRIEADAEIPAAGTLYISITIYEPDRSDGRVFAYGLNWESQAVTILEAA
jgi:phage gp46-like protein